MSHPGDKASTAAAPSWQRLPAGSVVPPFVPWAEAVTATQPLSIVDAAQHCVSQSVLFALLLGGQGAVWAGGGGSLPGTPAPAWSGGSASCHRLSSRCLSQTDGDCQRGSGRVPAPSACHMPADRGSLDACARVVGSAGGSCVQGWPGHCLTEADQCHTAR